MGNYSETLTMKLNRKTAEELSRLYPKIYYYYHYDAIPNSFVKEGIRWGRKDKILGFSEILQIWNSKTRKVPVGIMLAKMLHESAKNPYISLYEIGQHKSNPKFTEYELTSYGLFQALGMTLDAYGFTPSDKEDVYNSFTIDRQFDFFDKAMSNVMSKMKIKFPSASEDEIIWHSISHYGLPAMVADGRSSKAWKDFTAGKTFAPKSIQEAVKQNFTTYKAITVLDANYIKKWFKNEYTAVLEQLKK